MNLTAPDPIHLTRREPARNMARYYAVSLVPTLFGEIAVIRNWGRIGTKGRVRMETFEGAGEAKAAAGRIARAKRRRGYLVSGSG